MPWNTADNPIGQFAAGSGKKAGEFYTPQQISDILSGHRHARQPGAQDRQEEAAGQRVRLRLRLRLAAAQRAQAHGAARTSARSYGQEKNITTYNLARMNMLLHGVKDTEFEIYHGDTLTNDWDMLRETNPAKKPKFDAVVANPPFSYRWEPDGGAWATTCASKTTAWRPSPPPTSPSCCTAFTT